MPLQIVRMRRHRQRLRPPVGQAEQLGGIGATVAAGLHELTGKETRTVVLGHLLRGWSPTALDRLLGFDASEIALVVGANPAAVRQRLKRILDRLRQELG